MYAGVRPCHVEHNGRILVPFMCLASSFGPHLQPGEARRRGGGGAPWDGCLTCRGRLWAKASICMRNEAASRNSICPSLCVAKWFDCIDCTLYRTRPPVAGRPVTTECSAPGMHGVVCVRVCVCGGGGGAGAYAR